MGRGQIKDPFLCRLPELSQPCGLFSVTQKVMPDGYRLLVVGRKTNRLRGL